MANSTTNMDPVQTNAANKEAQVNAFIDAASMAATYARRASTTSGLTWGFYGGNVILTNKTRAQIANGTLTLTASSTNYVVALKSSGAASVSTTTTNWNSSLYWRLYEIVAGASTVTSYTDYRCPALYQGVEAALTDSPWPVVASDGGTSVTLALADAGTYKRMTASVAVTVTVPPQSSVAWAANTEIHIVQAGDGGVTIQPGSGVTLNYLSTVDPILAGKGGPVTLKRVAADEWDLFGALAEAAP